MFDFRYHALSLAAVFLALAVGLLLGVAIGDRELVSSAKEDLEGSLLRDARREAADLREDLRASERYANRSYPLLVGDELDGRRIGLIFLARPDERVADQVRVALRETGAEVQFIAVLRDPPDRDGLAARAEGTRYEALVSQDDLLEPFGLRMGVQLVVGGRLVERVRPDLFRSFSGELAPLDGVILARAPQDEPDEHGDALARGLVEGLQATDRPVVGVELSSTDPSQITWYRERGLTSVDSLDDIAGRAALVFALTGADGTFGRKPTADRLLPELAGR